MSQIDRAWLREIIANNDTFTAIELIIARHKRVLANKKRKWEQRKKHENNS